MHIKDVDVNYVDYGKKDKDTIILLHGWGQNIEMMKPIGDLFCDKYHIIIVDLPGFGKSEEPSYAWNIDDYVILLNTFVKENNINNPILVGHSFGGRVAIKYASKYEVKKLILFAAPMIKRKENLSTKQKVLKMLKKVPILNKSANFFKKYIGSTDYKKASIIMRQILVNTVNENLVEDAKKIKAPTIYIIGTNDQAVSVSEAMKVKDTIRDCGLITYDGLTHYAYLEDINKTKRILDIFFN